MTSPTNKTTILILDYLLAHKILARRINVIGVPIQRDGHTTGYRPSTMVGMPDILGWLPPSGRGLAIEIKTGKDKLRPEQITFLANFERMGGLVIVTSSFEDFKQKYESQTKTS